MYCNEQLTSDRKAVEDALNSFGFCEPLQLLQQLDKSLKMVKDNIKTAEQHKQLIANVDNKIKKLFLQIHPDRTMGQGGSEKEVEEAQEKQKALNACRMLIKKEFAEQTAFAKNAQPQPSGSLSGVEPERHSQSMSRD